MIIVFSDWLDKKYRERICIQETSFIYTGALWSNTNFCSNDIKYITSHCRVFSGFRGSFYQIATILSETEGGYSVWHAAEKGVF